MRIERTPAKAPRVEAVAERVAALRGPCIGCADCRGVCRALIEALVVPEAVLRAGPRK